MPIARQPQGYVTGALGAKFASVSRTYKASTSTSENSIPQGDVGAPSHNTTVTSPSTNSQRPTP